MFVRISRIALLALMATLLYEAPPAHGAHLNPVVIATISTSTGTPMGAAVNAVTNRIYAARKGDSAPLSLDVIDGESRTVLKTVSISGEFVWSVEVNTSTGRVYTVDAFSNILSI